MSPPESSHASAHTRLLPHGLTAGLPVGEEWVPTARWEPVRFPYDGSEIAHAPHGNEALARQAAEHAATLRHPVAKLPSQVRRRVLGGVTTALEAVAREMEDLLILERGKPRADCRTEVVRAMGTWQTAADEVAHMHGQTVPLDLPPSGDGTTGYFTRRPVGVVAGITGFNYPTMPATHKNAPTHTPSCPISAVRRRDRSRVQPRRWRP